MARTVSLYVLKSSEFAEKYFPTITSARLDAKQRGLKTRSYEIEPVDVELSTTGVANFINRVIRVS